MNRQKRVVAIHDISCVGKCSLTVALPILSAAGLECSALPTAVLSTHTGGFKNYTFRDLTADIEPIIRHWQSLDLQVDAVYTGYLGSFEQIALVDSFITAFRRQDTLVLVDPVMADNGSLYAAFASDFPQEMKKLCCRADVIIPNITEAVLMLGEEYHAGPYTKEYIEGLIRRLAQLGPRQVVLTGVCFNDSELGAASYDAAEDEVHYCMEKRIDGYYHGTGDVFGSALLGAVMNGVDLAEAVRIAVAYTVQAISLTKTAGTDIKYGVRFETCLPDYMKELKLLKV